MSRIIKSKFYKPFIALLVAIILVFSFEVNKPKAIVPILAYGAWMVAGIVAEEAIEMGIRHYTSTGQTKTKSKTKKVADAIFDNLDSFGFDFLKSNPKRKADGSLEVYPSANDRAKIARMIADEFDDVLEDDSFRRGSPDMGHEGIRIEPLDTVQSSYDAYDFLRIMSDTVVEKVDSDRDIIRFNSVITGKNHLSISSYDSKTGEVYRMHSYSTTSSTKKCMVARQFTDASPTTFVTHDGYCDDATIQAFEQYKFVKTLGKAIAYAGGLSVPSTLADVYPAPSNMSPTYQLPNYEDLSNKPHVIKNVYPVSESDDDSYTWETVNNDYETDTSIGTNIEGSVDTYLANGDMYKNTYNTQTVNNYYSDANYPIKSGDVTVIVDVDAPPPVVIDDDDDTSTGDLPPQAEVLDRTLISYAKQTYDYLGDSIDGAITSMRDITDDASGLVDYLDTSFRWLPAEWRALFGSAFILGVFAHFMRR